MKHRQSILEWIVTIVKWVIVVILIMFFIKEAKVAYQLGYDIFAQEAMAEEGMGTTVSVTITEGMSVKQIGELLEEQGLIKDATVFPFQERFSSYHDEIKPGIYELSTEMTVDEMLEIMAGSGAEEEEES